MKQLVVVMLAVLMWWTHAECADTVYPERPKDVRITGTFLPPTEQGREDLVTVNIFLRDTPRVFRVGKIENLTETERERAVKEDILIRQVRFYGPDVLIDKLQQPDIVGKVIIIEGRLDTQERRFLVKSVTEASGEEILSPSSK